VHDRYTIEIARGCAVGCRFCQAGYIYRPVREREPQDIKASVAEGLRRTGFNEVTLLSLNAGEYEGVEELVRQVAAAGASQKVGVSMPSLRVSALTKELAQSLSAGRKSGFTLAPEAGTQRLRDVINKQATEEDLQRAATAVFSSGWNLVKLYFMLGLPTETEEDVEGIARLAKLVVRAGREANCKNPQVNLSASCFVPKPFTPFQWRPMESPDALRAKQERLRGSLKRPVTFRWHDVEASLVEAVFSLGDRRLAPVLERAAELGCAFDGWGEHFNAPLWRQAFADAGVPVEDYLFRERERSERLPWDHIDVGILKAFLWREWEKAKEGATTEKCGPESCHACGFFARECMDDAFARSPVEPQVIPVSRAAATLTTHRYRLRFRKQGLARFIGHLDLMEMLVRALRRCGVILAYTKGYHPIPKVEFPPPLPLGVEGLEEWMEFSAPPLDRPGVVSRLASALPAGVVPERLFLVPAQAPGLSALSVQVYGVDASDLETKELDDLRARVEAFEGAPEWIVQREAKGQTKALDLKGRVVGTSWEGDLLRVRLLQGGLMDLVESLCPSPASDRLNLSRLGLEFAE
jgi:radical SAM-linked protein